MSVEVFLRALPAAQRKHLDPRSPPPIRMMAAQGLAPLPPRDLVLVLCGLALDEDAALAQKARATLAGLPEAILGPIVAGSLPAAAYSAVADICAGNEKVLEGLALNREIEDAVLADFVVDAPAGVAEIVAGNQERCLRSEALVRALCRNASWMKSSRDRLFDFLVRAGVLYEGLPETQEAMARLSSTEMQTFADTVELPDDLETLLHEPPAVDSRTQTAAEDLGNPLGDEDEEARVPVFKMIRQLNTAQKVALAIRGNKEARAILMREKNRVVATAAIRNPRVTESEVVAAAKSRQVHDDVVRIIANSRDMTRAYGVKLALVTNPKTPLPTALRFMSLLRAHDLRGLAKSKDVPTAVANQAKRLVSAKR